MAELQAWIGQLFIVGGRAVRTPPPGALAELAPRRGPRIREGDSFFILVTPAGDLRASAAFFEELAQLGADTYFGSSGGITSGLREVLSAINRQATAQTVNALALVLHGSDLFAARAGQSFAALCQDDGITFFPEDRRDPLGSHLSPLGTGPTPDIQLGHYTAVPGQSILLAGPHLMQADDDALRAALDAGALQASLDALKAIAGPQAAASVIRLVPPGTPDPTGTTPQPGGRAVRTAAARPSKPAARPDTLPDTLAEPAVELPPRPPSRSAPHETAPPAAESPAAPDRVETSVLVAESMPAVSPPETTEQNPFAAPVERPPRHISALRQNMWRAPSPEAPRPSPLQQISIGIKRAGRDVVRAALTGLLTLTDWITRAFNQIVPAPGAGGKQGIPTNIAVGLVLLIPLVIVVVVVGLALSEQGKSEFEVYLDRANTAHQEALTLSGGKCDNVALRPLWIEVMRLAEQAEQFRPNDANIAVIWADARNYLDCFDVVQRRDLVLLREFERGAELAGPVVNGGIDLFTLDRTNSRVYHDTLNVRGDGIAASDSSPIIWRGQAISSASGMYTVGDLIDIQWLSSGGTAHDNVLIALDRSGVLVAYSMTFLESAQQLIISGWQNPVALAVFRSNIYVLDAGANQIWRYVQPAGERRYSSAPEEYFNGAELPDLSTAVDFGISDEGAIYILFADGTITKYRRDAQNMAEEQPFFYKELPPGAINSGKALFVDNDPASASLYIMDQSNETVYETSWSGRYQSGYRPANMTDAFAQVSGLFADAVSRNNMYVVAGNKLYHFKRR